MIRNFRVANGALIASDQAESSIRVFVAPEAQEVAELQRSFGVDAHTVASALDPDEVSRIELLPNCVSIIWKRPVSRVGEGARSFRVASIGFFLRKEALAIVTAEDLSMDDQEPRRIRPSTAIDVLFNLLDGTIRHYLEHLRLIKAMSQELQQKIAVSMENRYLLQMFSLSESLVYYIDATSENGEVLNRLRTDLESAGTPVEQLESLDDVIVENRQCARQAEIYSIVLSGLMDARGNLVNNNMNVLLKKLTVINVVFLPLNLIASIGGMSEFTMMTGNTDWRLSYSLFLLLMIAIGALTAVLVHLLDVRSRKGT